VLSSISGSGTHNEATPCKQVSYIQPPPQQANNEPSSAESVMKYLARYLTGGPISDHRLISADARSVTFWAREGTTTGGDSKQILVTLSRLEFTRRWCLHILPAGFTKSRTLVAGTTGLARAT